MQKIRRNTAFTLMLCLVLSMTVGCSKKREALDYANLDNWAYAEIENTDKKADIFFVCPTVFMGNDKDENMSLSDTVTMESFVGATNMEKGIYDDEGRFFAPYYRQAGLSVYSLSASKREKYLKFAYEDVLEAFQFYLSEYNDGRPIVLAGFSQGADMCLRLLKDAFSDEQTNKLLVACYAIGWSITEDEMKANPHLKFASAEDDTGVIIAFNSEAEEINDSLMIPKGTKTLAINPLNWMTDSTAADRNLNLGACFPDYSGEVTKEIRKLTGAYIDEERGALKVTDVTAEQYPSGLDIFEDGIFHLYDYQFFYRNLQKNVQTRIDAYFTDNQ